MFQALRSSDLSVVNKIFYDYNLILKNDYQNALLKTYKSSAQAIDFSNIDLAANYINNWIKLNTKSHIKEVVKAGNYTPYNIQS